MIRRVLVVDDHEAWRQQICSILRKSGKWQVIGEAADGVEAIQKTDALKPHVVLLDVELPELSGIEAARQILALDPKSRILFLSAHGSRDIVEAALSTGARGYVTKSAAGYELLAALDAVVEGKRFVSAFLTGRTVERTTVERDGYAPRRHEAGFYSNGAFLLDGYVRFADAALGAGKVLVMVLGETRRNELHRRLHARGWDLDLAVKEHRFLSLDIAETLSGFMVDGWPDEGRFWQAGTSLVLEAASAARETQPVIAACGECAGTLLAAGNAAAAIRLEHLWDEFARTYNVEIFCGYAMKPPQEGEGEDIDVFRRICAEHSAIHSQ